MTEGENNVRKIKTRSGAISGAALMLISGIIFIVFPKWTSGVIGLLFGIIIVLYGITETVNYFLYARHMRGGEIIIFRSIFLIISGSIFIIRPDSFIPFMYMFAGIFFFMEGIVRLQSSLIKAPFRGALRWISVILSFVLMILGIMMIADPFGGSYILIMIFGGGLVINAFQTFSNAFT